jgi:predicted enzyme related to lactoylglutathione lyase
MANRFCHYELRTIDVDAAREFYSDLLGWSFWGEGVDVVPLPAQAAARGAPPHWLGHIGVDDVTASVSRFVQHGATPLGPLVPTYGTERAIVRDPFGAVVALTSAACAARGDRIVWQVLNARDETAAFAVYRDLFGWTPLEALDLGADRGRYQTFRWNDSTDAVGSTSNAASQPQVHPQWLFFFGTANLSASLALVRARGGLSVGVIETPNGHLVAPCDDPQGAAFGLYEVIRG